MLGATKAFGGRLLAVVYSLQIEVTQRDQQEPIRVKKAPDPLQGMGSISLEASLTPDKKLGATSRYLTFTCPRSTHPSGSSYTLRSCLNCL